MAIPDSATSASIVAQAATGTQAAFAQLAAAHHAPIARVIESIRFLDALPKP
jgi:hypothetical protein